jgi:hypothetical protein
MLRSLTAVALIGVERLAEQHQPDQRNERAKQQGQDNRGFHPVTHKTGTSSLKCLQPRIGNAGNLPAVSDADMARLAGDVDHVRF